MFHCREGSAIITTGFERKMISMKVESGFESDGITGHLLVLQMPAVKEKTRGKSKILR